MSFKWKSLPETLELELIQPAYLYKSTGHFFVPPGWRTTNPIFYLILISGRIRRAYVWIRYRDGYYNEGNSKWTDWKWYKVSQNNAALNRATLESTSIIEFLTVTGRAFGDTIRKEFGMGFHGNETQREACPDPKRIK